MQRVVGFVVPLLIFAGCVSAPKLPDAAAPSPNPTPPPIAAPPPTASAMSYGLVTSRVRKGETTQLELVQLFGAPNISSYDSAGVETWVYERSVTQTDVQTQSKAVQAAANLGLFFGDVGVGGGVAGGQSTQAASMSSSLRSITVIVKFDAKKIVSDFSVRSSNF